MSSSTDVWPSGKMGYRLKLESSTVRVNIKLVQVADSRKCKNLTWIKFNTQADDRIVTEKSEGKSAIFDFTSNINRKKLNNNNKT